MLLACCPVMCAAQSEWEAPVSNNATTTKVVKKVKKNEATADKAVANKEIKDWNYIREDAVPEVDGKVVFNYNCELPGKTAQQIYDLTYTALDSLAHTPNQIKSGIALINRKEHVIASRNLEWLEFSKSFVSLDRTKFGYTIIAKCTDNHLHLSIERISYTYEEERSTGFHTTAEKWITNKNAVNKKGTKLTPGMAKFRKKTIDRKDAIFKYITDFIKR